MNFYEKPAPPQCLMHYGVKGMKWGVRRYEDKNGHLTTKGKERYNSSEPQKQHGLTERQKKLAIAGIVTAATLTATYGAYKLGAFDKVLPKGRDAVDRLLSGSLGTEKTSSPKLSKIGLQFFAKKPSDFKTVRLPKKEYAHVMSEIATHLTSEERTKDTVVKYIGQYRYMAQNLHDGTFRIIGKSRIT